MSADRICVCNDWFLRLHCQVRCRSRNRNWSVTYFGNIIIYSRFYRDFEKSNQFSANPHQVRASSSTSPPHAAPAKSSSAFRKPSQIQTNRDMAVASIDRGAASESSETGAVVSPSSSPPASLRLQSVASSMRPSVRGTGLTMEQRITLNGIAVTLCFLVSFWISSRDRSSHSSNHTAP